MHQVTVNERLILAAATPSVSDKIDTVDIPQKTEILYKPDEILQRSIQELANAKETVDSCVDGLAATMILKVEVLKRVTKDGVARGVRNRIVTQITKKNLSDCKELMKIVQLRHMDGIKGNFNISDRKLYAGGGGIDTEDGKFPSQYIFSNIPAFVQQQQYFFDMLWDKAIPAEERIRQIEEQREPEFSEVITDSQKAAEKVIEFAKSVKQEALIMLPVAKTAVRLDKVGFWDHLIHAANNGARIRLMCPLASANQSIIDRISQLASISVLGSEPTTAGFFVLDEKRYLRAEVIHSEADSLSDALGFLEYSNSKTGILYFKTFFEVIWRQLQSYQTLRDLNKMQNEFISIAAHELKNPVQPILGLAQILRDKASDQDRQLLDIIVRNAKKLVEMQDNILDVTRIDNNNLRLRKEQTNLKEVIADVVQAHRSQASNTELVVHSSDVYVYADRNRIVQVISNLLANAIKFTLAGTIVISLEKNSDHAVVLVKDSGIGLDNAVIPKLFTKFFTTSENGTGLGLFISKSIVEAHGGKIWAENSNDKGATFGFSLPVLEKS